MHAIVIRIMTLIIIIIVITSIIITTIIPIIIITIIILTILIVIEIVCFRSPELIVYIIDLFYCFYVLKSHSFVL